MKNSIHVFNTNLKYQCQTYKECGEIFYGIVLKKPKLITSESNNGFFALDNNEGSISIFTYYREKKAEGLSHTELEILNIFKNLNTGVILLSSWNCPCLSCLEALISFVETHDTIINIYCFQYYEIEKFPNFPSFLSEQGYFKNAKLLTHSDILNRFHQIICGKVQIHRLNIFSLNKEECKKLLEN